MMIRFILLLNLFVTASSLFAATQTLFLDNATERVVVEHDPALNPSSGVTIEAWVRPTTISNCQTIVGKGFQTGYWLGLCNGRIRYYSNGTGTRRDGNSAVSTGAWRHIVVTFDGSERRYYLNGDLDSSASTPGSLAHNTDPLGIGGEGGSATFPGGLFPFSGYLSEVRLWNYARSQDQIRSTMYQQITAAQPGLIAVWALEGGEADRFGAFHSARPEQHDRQFSNVRLGASRQSIGFASIGIGFRIRDRLRDAHSTFDLR